jgi:ABC-type methionine transport system permease subunit
MLILTCLIVELTPSARLMSRSSTLSNATTVLFTTGAEKFLATVVESSWMIQETRAVAWTPV